MSDNQESATSKTDNSEIPTPCDNINDNGINNNNNQNNNNDNNGNNSNNQQSEIQSNDNEPLSLSPPCSEYSVASTASSKIPKPSRIGRLCTGVQKPSLPPAAIPSSKKSSDDCLRKMTDDFGRHRLTDLLEADESEEDTSGCYRMHSPHRYRYSSFGSHGSSLEGLWDTHGGRLSEAGLSRHSDSSAILTEDTDSFMIGQRVWVGGTKPGTIAFIGETQFAPGDWAGIALDEPIGKNDGTVGGIHYFQCEPKKGIFSRLTRLTRAPLENPAMGSNETFMQSTPNGVRRSPISPTGSTKGSIRSPVSLSASNTSLSHSIAHADFKIGDRVIIRSSQGSKVGTVRYMGLTDFAPGEWVGVELDDPRGKNDGSVEGKRYFECRPNFGLFAPVAKVSKSPSKIKPGACALHGGVPPSGLRRVNSKESMTSLASKTSLASSNIRRVRLGVTSLTSKKTPSKLTTPLSARPSLQDVLRDKQQQIEQLLKERDLERAQITKAAGQADEAEQKLFHLQQEYDHYRAECDLKLREQLELLSHLKLNEKELLSQLDDERRKNEDLLFRFEEAAINKGDLEVTNESNIERIKELERQLDEELKKSENLETLSNKLFETEEILIKTRDELDTTKNQLEEIRSRRDTIEQQHQSSNEIISGLQKELENVRNLNRKLEENYQKLNDEFVKVTNERDQLQQSRTAEIDKIKSELSEKLKIIEQLENEKYEVLKENDRLQVDLKQTSTDLENANNKISAQQEELKIVKEELTRKIDEAEKLQQNSSANQDNLKESLNEIETKHKSTIKELEGVRKELAIKDEKLKESEDVLKKQSDEIMQLTEELNGVRLKHSESTNDIEVRHKRQTDEIEAKLDSLHKELQMKINESNSYSIVISKLEDDICKKNGIIDKLNLELDSIRRQFATNDNNFKAIFDELSHIKMAYNELELNHNTLQQNYEQLLQQKQQLEQQLQSEFEKCNDAKLDELRKELQQRENNLIGVRQEFLEKLQNSDRIRQQIESELALKIQQFERIQFELEEKLQIALKSEELLKQRCETALAERIALTDDNLMKIQQLEQQLFVKDQELGRIVEESHQQERLLKNELDMLTVEFNKRKQLDDEHINNLNDEMRKINEALVGKSEELIEINSKYNLLIAENRQNQLNEIGQFNDKIKHLELELEEKNDKLKQLINEMALLKSDCQNKNVDVVEKDHKISELLVELQSRQNLINTMQEQFNNHELIKQESLNKYNEQQQYCDNLKQQLEILNDKLQINEQLIINLQLERKNFIDLMQKLHISDIEKKNYIKQIEDEINRTGERERCQNILELLKNLQVDNIDEINRKVVDLEKLLELTQKQLNDRNQQCEQQKMDLLKLQQELITARQANTTTTSKEGQSPDHNTVSFITQHQQQDQYNTLHKQYNTHINPHLIQMRTQQIQNSLTNILQKYESLRHENINFIQINNPIESDLNMRMLQSLNRFRFDLVQFWKIVNSEREQLQKNLQDISLLLQKKDHQSYQFLTRINYLNQVLNNLPTACRKFTINQQSQLFVNNNHNNINKNNMNCQNFIIETVRNREIINLRNYEIQTLKIELNNLLKHFEINNRIRQDQSRVIVKEVPIYIPQTPRVIVKQIPVPVAVPQGKQIQPKLIIQHVPIMVPVQPKVLIKQVPVKVPVIINNCTTNFMPGECTTITPNSKVSTTVSNNSHITTIKPQITRITPHLNVEVPPKIIIKEIPVPLPPKILIKQIPVPVMVPQGTPIKPTVLIKQVPKFIKMPVYIQQLSQSQQQMCQSLSKHIIYVPQPPKIIYRSYPYVINNCQRQIVKVPILSAPKILIKQVPVPVAVPQGSHIKPIVLIKQIPVPVPKICPSVVPTSRQQQIVYVPQPPKILTKQIPVFIQTCSQQKSDNNGNGTSRVANISNQMSLKPKILIKQIPVFLQSPPRVIVEKVPPKILIKHIPLVRTVPIIVPTKPRIIVKETKVPIVIRQPPRILIRQIPVAVPQLPNSSTKPIVLIKQVPVTVPYIKSCPPNKIQTIRVPPIVVTVPKREIIKVPIYVCPKLIADQQNLKSKLSVSDLSSQNQMRTAQVPVSCPLAVKVPIYVPRPAQIRFVPQQIPIVVPKVIVKKVTIPRIIKEPVYIPRILVKQVPIPVPVSRNVSVKPIILTKQIPVYFPSKTVIKYLPGPIRIITHKVPVYITRPSKTIIKEVPKLIIKKVPEIVKVPIVSQSQIKQVPIYITQPPKTILKYLPGPTKVISKTVPLEVPVYIPQPAKIVVKEIPKLIIKKVPQIIKVPTYITQAPRILVKQVPIPVPVSRNVSSKPTVLIKQIPVYIRQPPKIVLKYVAGPTKIITQQVPFKVPVYLPQSPKVIVKEIPKLVIKKIPVYIPQSPRILVKQVPIPVPVSRNISTKPTVLMKQVPVYIPQPPKIIFKYVPGPTKTITQKVPVYISQPSKIIVKEVPRLIVKQIPQIVKIPIYIPQSPRILVKQVPIPVPVSRKVSTKPTILMKQVPVYIVQPPKILPKYLPGPTKIVTQRVPIYISQPPKMIVKEVPKLIIKRIPQIVKMPIYIAQSPRILVKQVPIPVPVSRNVSVKPTILIKQVPVYVPQSPKIVLKYMPGPTKIIERKVPIEVPVYIPKYKTIVKDVPRLIVKKVPQIVRIPIYVQQTPRILIKQVPIPVPVPKVNSTKPTVLIKQIPVYINRPIKTIIKYLPGETKIIKYKVPIQVPVYIRQPPKVIIKPVPTYIDRPRILIKQIPVAVPLSRNIATRPVTVVKQVPVYINRPPKIITVPRVEVITKKIPVYISKTVPIYIPQPPRVILKQVPKIVQIPTSTPIKPSIIVKQVPVYVRQAPKIITKRVFVRVPLLHTVTKVKQVPVYIPQTPRILVKPVRVPVEVPKLVPTEPKIVTREVPIYVRQPPQILTKPVLIRVPQYIKERVHVPVEFTKYVKVPVHIPPKIVTRTKIIPQKIPVYIEKIIRVPQILVKQVPPKVIIKHLPGETKIVKVPTQVPIYIPQAPKVLIKQIPVPVPVSRYVPVKPKVLIKQVPVYISKPPQIVTKRILIPVENQVVQRPKPVPIIVPKIVKVPIYIRQKPQILTKQVPIIVKVPYNVPVKNSIITKQIPVPVKVLVPVPVIRIKKIKVPVIIPKICPKASKIIVSRGDQAQSSQLGQAQIRKVPVPILVPNSCPIQQPPIKVPVYLPQRPRILIKQVPIYISKPPQIVTKRILIPVENQVVQRPKPVPIIVPKIVKIPIYIRQKPQILTKQVPIIVKVPYNVPVKNSIITKQIPVPVKVLVPVPVIRTKKIKVPVVIPRICPKASKIIIQRGDQAQSASLAQAQIRKVPVPILVPNSCPIQTPPIKVPVYLPQRPRILIKQVPVYITKPPQIVQKPIVVPKIVKVPIYIRQSPQIITKQIPIIVKVPYNVPVRPSIITKQIPVPVKIPELVPVIRIKKVKVPVVIPRICPKASKIIIQRGDQAQSSRLAQAQIREVPVPVLVPNACPTQRPAIKIPVYLPQRPRILIKQVPVPVPVPKNTPIKTKIIIKQVPISIPTPRICPKQKKLVYVRQPPRLLIKQVPVFVGKNCPRTLIKQIPVPVVVPSSPNMYHGRAKTKNGHYHHVSVIAESITQPWHEIWEIIENVRSRIRTNISRGIVQRSGTIPIRQDWASKLLAYLVDLRSNYMSTAHKLQQSRRAVCLLRHFNWRLMEFGNEVLRKSNQMNAVRATVPIPLAHMMRQKIPNLFMPNQNLMKNLNIAESLYQIQRQTQNTLKQCMDAALVQTLSLDKCRNQLIQDKEMAENQIKFLNSIIADIQKKNEEQRARIEILESASNFTIGDHTKLLQKRQTAPRMYCDICEEFDLHETEDCPQQSSDTAPNLDARLPRETKERPYCEICEAFGHSTEECPDDETY